MPRGRPSEASDPFNLLVRQRTNHLAECVADLIRAIANDLERRPAAQTLTHDHTYLTLPQAAERARVSTWRVWKACKDGLLAARPTGPGRSLRIDIRDLDNWRVRFK